MQVNNPFYVALLLTAENSLKKIWQIVPQRRKQQMAEPHWKDPRTMESLKHCKKGNLFDSMYLRKGDTSRA